MKDLLKTAAAVIIFIPILGCEKQDEFRNRNFDQQQQSDTQSYELFECALVSGAKATFDFCAGPFDTKPTWKVFKEHDEVKMNYEREYASFLVGQQCEPIVEPNFTPSVSSSSSPGMYCANVTFCCSNKPASCTNIKEKDACLYVANKCTWKDNARTHCQNIPSETEQINPSSSPSP